MRVDDPHSALSKNNLSSLVKDIDSTDASFTRAPPLSLERRRESHGVVLGNKKRLVALDESTRPSSLVKAAQLPANLKINKISESDLAIYDVSHASKRSMIRANLYN